MVSRSTRTDGVPGWKYRCHTHPGGSAAERGRTATRDCETRTHPYVRGGHARLNVSQRVRTLTVFHATVSHFGRAFEPPALSAESPTRGAEPPALATKSPALGTESPALNRESSFPHTELTLPNS